MQVFRQLVVAAIVSVFSCSGIQAQQEFQAADFLPDSTQGFIRLANVPEFVERWNSTQFGILGQDERLKPFWDDQRAAIEKRFSEAGWQLNLHVEDLETIATGEAAIGWIALPQNTMKPYAVNLIIDVHGKDAEVEALLKKIDAEMIALKATVQNTKYKEFPITRYTLPREAGALQIRESLYSVVDGYLLAADDLTSLQALIEAKLSGLSNSLSKSDLFLTATKRLPDPSRNYQLEYFVRPIGLAKLLRVIAGKTVASPTDILKVLEKQGFDKIAAACGQIRFGVSPFDVLHDAFVQTIPPLPRSVQVLDFPNEAGRVIPDWVTKDASSFFATAWNAKDAFWKVDDIVDEIAGQQGVFESVIEGIQTDPLGPQIDIRNQVLPYLTPEIYSISDTVEPITPDSRRSLIAIRIKDANGKLAGVLERAMKNEPEAKPEDFVGYRIWKVTRSDDAASNVELQNDFNIGNTKPKSTNAADEEKPILNNWAITIFQGEKKEDSFLMFASHAEMIKDAITLSKSKDKSLLAEEKDVQRVTDAIRDLTNDSDLSGWQIQRTDRSFQMQYELFRQDQLPQSRSMMATVLDRILRPKDEVKKTDQRVKGNKLPVFDQISEYFMPAGSSVKTHDDGWSFQGFVLAKPTE